MCVATNDAGVVERSVTLTLQRKDLSVIATSCELEPATYSSFAQCHPLFLNS